MVELGTGTNEAAVFTRGGGTPLLSLGGVVGPERAGATALKWGRVVNDVSMASVTLNGAPKGVARSALGNLATWAYELVMFRDGARVWEGPITNLRWTSTGMVITGRDVSFWTSRTNIHTYRQTETPNPVTDEGTLTLDRAFAGFDPNVLPHRQVITHPAQANITRDVRVNSGVYLDDLKKLAGQGLNWTTIGRRIVLFPDEAVIGQTATLIPERDMVADVEVEESGEDLWTVAVAHNQNDVYAAGAAPGVPQGGVDPFYGLHSHPINASDVPDQAGLLDVAHANVAHTYPAPLILTVPQGAKLNPTAPILLEHLVPGVVVPVESRATARRVSQALVLRAVNVEQTPAGETITVDLTQPSTLTGS